MKYTSFLLITLGLLALAHASLADEQLSGPQASGIFTGKDAATVIAEAIMRQTGGSDVKVTIAEARDEDVLAQSAGGISAEADSLEADKAHNHWQALLLLKADGRNLAPIKLSGHYDEMAQIPILRRQLQAGEVIAEGDIDWDKVPAARLRKNTITDIHDLIGKSPKHTISQGRPIRTDEIASQAIVSKGTQVTLFFKSHNIEIKTYGEALDSGAKGDVIRVRNTASKSIIEGTVDAPERVRVMTPDSDSAEAM